jgi:sugar phosphate isomerase/epimerase
VQGKPQEYMTVGIVHFMAFPQTMGGSGPIVETVGRIANDPFFGAVEVGPVTDATARRELRELLKGKSFQVGFGLQPIELANKLDINSLDEATRKASLDKVKEGIDMAAEIGASRLGLLSGPDTTAENRAAATDALVDSLDQICAYGKSKGIDSVAMETFDWLIDKKSLIGPNADGVAVSARVRKKHRGFGLMIDLSHFPLQFEKTADAVKSTQEHTVHAHMGNCVLERGHKLYGDLHPHFGIKGGYNDIAELTEYLRCLLETGYIGRGSKNIVAFEVRPHGSHENDNSEWVINNSKQTLEKAWAAV